MKHPSKKFRFVAPFMTFIALCIGLYACSGQKESTTSTSGEALVLSENCFVPPATAPPDWAPQRSYATGALVTFGGTVYRARQAHTSMVGWEPTAVLALWVKPDPCGVQAWATQTDYKAGAVVTHGNSIYSVIQPHVSLPGWEPTATPALWARVSTCSIGTAGTCSETINGDASTVHYVTQITCDNQVVSLEDSASSNATARTTSSESTLRRGGQLVSADVVDAQETTTHSQVTWASPFVTGASSASFSSNGATVTGSVDGRAIVPVAVSSATNPFGTFQFQDGRPSPKLQVTAAVAGQIALLSAKANAELEAGICGNAAATALLKVPTAPDGGVSVASQGVVALAVAGGENCDNCRGTCDDINLGCYIGVAGTCAATLGFGCLGVVGCNVAWGKCQTLCEGEGAACCPVKCPGGACCNNNETCTSSGGTICCPNADVCGSTCCGGGRTCLGGSVCCNADKVCGSQCCGNGLNCIDHAVGTCCSAGNSCGTACCGPGQRCDDPSTNTCVNCPVTCNGACCGDTQVCNGTTCCAPDKVCGSACCGSGTSCVNPATGACAGVSFFVDVKATVFQTGGPEICGNGTLFTPGGGVTIAYKNIPRVGNTMPHNVATADPGGNISFTDTSIQGIAFGMCTTDELFSTVTAEVTDVATGRVLTDTLDPCIFCLNTICPIAQCK